MSFSTNVSIIGSGNIAWHLAPALDNAGYVVKEVYSRNPKNAEALIKKLYQAELKSDLDFSTSNSEIFIVAVSDDAISEVAQEIVLPENAIIVHTSGAKPMSTLAYSATENFGVFYPLQTFSKASKIHWEEIPICIEAENKTTRSALKEMGFAISNRVVKMSSNDRKALHVAAVFACNFTNHFLKIAGNILNKEKLNFDLLHPLILETINKAIAIGPEKSQTGPAKRHDFETLDHHMDYLAQQEELAELYKTISQNIIDSYPQD